MARKILLVDDEPDVLTSSRSRLEAHGYQVVTAENGVQGLEKVRSEKPHLIVLDANMPELNGFEMFDQLRQDKDHRDIPVIMVTAAGQVENIKKGMDLGAVSYITKPFKMELLLSLIQGVLGAEEKK